MIKRIFRFIYWSIRIVFAYVFYILGAPFMLIGKPLWWVAWWLTGVRK